MKSHRNEAEDDRDPIQIVRDDGTICRRILPAEKCVEDSPSSSTIQAWTTALKKISANWDQCWLEGHER